MTFFVCSTTFALIVPSCSWSYQRGPLSSRHVKCLNYIVTPFTFLSIPEESEATKPRSVLKRIEYGKGKSQISLKMYKWVDKLNCKLDQRPKKVQKEEEDSRNVLLFVYLYGMRHQSNKG